MPVFVCGISSDHRRVFFLSMFRVLWSCSDIGLDTSKKRSNVNPVKHLHLILCLPLTITILALWLLSVFAIWNVSAYFFVWLTQCPILYVCSRREEDYWLKSKYCRCTLISSVCSHGFTSAQSGGSDSSTGPCWGSGCFGNALLAGGTVHLAKVFACRTGLHLLLHWSVLWWQI